LRGTDRQFLTYALDLATEQMASRGDEFGDDDTAALEKLRRLANEHGKPWLSDAARIGRALIWTWSYSGEGERGAGYRAAQVEVRALLTGERGNVEEPQVKDDER
jgi:hypothetical protein